MTVKEEAQAIFPCRQSAAKVYNGLIWNLRKQYEETGKSPTSKSNINKMMKDLPHCKEYDSLSAQGPAG
jgi:hypothetical protein